MNDDENNIDVQMLIKHVRGKFSTIDLLIIIIYDYCFILYKCDQSAKQKKKRKLERS